MTTNQTRMIPDYKTLIEQAREPLPVIGGERGYPGTPNVHTIEAERRQLADALEQLLKEREITDEMVERAAISARNKWLAWDDLQTPHWDHAGTHTQKRWRNVARAALEAALQPQKPAP